MAAALWRKGEYERSVPIYADVVERLRRTLGPDAPTTLYACANLAVNLRDAGKLDEAIALFEDTLARLEPLGAEVAEIVSFARSNPLRALAQAGRIDDAVALARPQVESARRHPAGSAALAGELVQIAVVLLDAGVHAEAEQLLREVLDIRERLAPTAWTTSNTRALLGEALF